jgi:[CysO sulfur-carrier protein]-S-L-cysteine hydrolase
MIKLNATQLKEVLANALDVSPAECCGLIGGKDNGCAESVYQLRNVAADPRVSYEVAPEELFVAQRQMRERGEQLIAIYHSHPRSAVPEPSDTDIRLAYYPSAIYLIIGLGGNEPVMRAFRISEREKHWEEVEYVIVDE